ncbi:MAG: class IV adenylate cyclase [Spirochaetota bacterium]
MLEMEIKGHCACHDAMKKILLERGAREAGTVEEIDYYYNHPSRDFKTTHEALRLRVENGQCRITYKGPKLEGPVKTRFEAETGIEDYNTMKSVLEHLGFCYAGTVEKTRRIFDLDSFTVCLDSVKGIGDFIEIEKIGEEKTETERALVLFAASLGVTEYEKRSYLGMVLGSDEP